MYKLFILLFIFLLSKYSFSEILKLDQDLKSNLYVDTSTIIRKSDRVIITSIKDFNQIQYVDNVNFLSIKNSIEFDCKLGRHKILFSSLHSENMASNKPFGVDKTLSNWLKDKATSDAGKISEFACNKTVTSFSLMESCLESANETKKISPIILDKFSSILNVICHESLSQVVMTFNYSLTMLKADVKKENIDSFFVFGKNKFCTDPDSNQLLRSYDIEWKLLDKKGVFISSKIYRKEDCR